MRWKTSMDVEFTVDVISSKSISGPRVESATHIMAMGLHGSLDGAFRTATANMAQWLTDDYKLTPSEVAQVLGTAGEYKLSCRPQRRNSPQDQQGPPATPHPGQIGRHLRSCRLALGDRRLRKLPIWPQTAAQGPVNRGDSFESQTGPPLEARLRTAKVDRWWEDRSRQKSLRARTEFSR